MKKAVGILIALTLILSMSTIGASAAYLSGGTGYTSSGNVTWTFTLSSTAPASPNYQYAATSYVTFGGVKMNSTSVYVETSNNTSGQNRFYSEVSGGTSALYSSSKPSWAKGSFNTRDAIYGTAAHATGQVTYRT